MLHELLLQSLSNQHQAYRHKKENRVPVRGARAQGSEEEVSSRAGTVEHTQ